MHIKAWFKNNDAPGVIDPADGAKDQE